MFPVREDSVISDGDNLASFPDRCGSVIPGLTGNLKDVRSLPRNPLRTPKKCNRLATNRWKIRTVLRGLQKAAGRV